LSSAPHYLLSQANKIWLANGPDNNLVPLSTTTPSQWATQQLAIHLSLAYAQHLSTSIATTLAHDQYHNCKEKEGDDAVEA
jgi:hypothetical protein